MERQLGNPFAATAPKGTHGKIRGVVGHIKWAYYVAADVHGYIVTRSDEGVWSLHGFVGHADAFKMSQRPLTFIAPHQGGEWIWPIESLEVAEGALTARLSPPKDIPL